VRTRNQKIALARRILRLAARVWRFLGTNLTWLREAPEILLEMGHHARVAYPLDEAEQRLLFAELPEAVTMMARFAVATGARDQEFCRLEWQWERRIRIEDGKASPRSVFVLPAEIVKGGVARVLVLNDEAQAIVEAVRGRAAGSCSCRLVGADRSGTCGTPDGNPPGGGRPTYIESAWGRTRRKASNGSGFMTCGTPLADGYERPGWPGRSAGPVGAQGPRRHDPLQRARDRQSSGGGEPDRGIPRKSHANFASGMRKRL
jgi:integrase